MKTELKKQRANKIKKKKKMGKMKRYTRQNERT